jgi:asparagine synthase (glutamine-hydrolysing)
MCGIAGFIGSGGYEVLQRMTDAIRHRGPDAEGHWSEPDAGVFLGFRRLAIVDLVGGSQPMWTRDGALGVVFNGEIYNHLELRAELQQRGCEFMTDHSDTEVLLHGYREWGEAFVERLNGMWAFVIYDRARRRLFGSRDRFGKKPLYYFYEGDTFGFASELPALLQHPACPRNISPLSLKKYFAYCYIPAPRSIYERVWKLPGGHNFTLDLSPLASRLRVWRWWEFVLEPDPRLLGRSFTLAKSEDKPRDLRKLYEREQIIAAPLLREFEQGIELETLCGEIRATLDRAVQRRLMSDVPLGVFLSGGIDSSAIAALAAKHVPEGQLNTFSIGFNEPSFDESSYARLVAERLGTRHREEILDLDKSVALVPNIVSRLDEPLGDGSLLPTFLLSRFTRQHVTVALGGDGGDELFAGYDPFRALKKAKLYAKLVPKPLHAGIRHLAARLPVSHANMSFDFKVKRTLMGLSYPPPLWNAVWMSAAEPREIDDLFREPTPVEELYSEAVEAWDRCAQPNIVDRALQFWTNLYLQDGILAKVDRASMLNSLEARSPFLDIEVVDLARRIPWQLKLHGGTTKWILKKALAPLLPREIIERPKKGFGMPIGRWLREGKFDFDPAEASPLLDPQFIARKFTEHRVDRADHRLFLWSCWLFAQWHRR